MDLCLVFLILVITIGIALFLWANQYTELIPFFVGGMCGINNLYTEYDKNENVIMGGKSVYKFADTDLNFKKVILSDDAKFIFDGHNLIHDIQGTSLSVNEFKEGLRKISDIISKALPNKQLHIVIKNPNEIQTELFNEKFKADQKKILHDTIQNKKYKTKPKTEENIPYFKELTNLSIEYPNITYHLAYGKEPKSKSILSPKKHHLKGRDDFLSLYLSKNGYIVSHDRFRDFSKFKDIKPFFHFSVTNHVIHNKERIKPKLFFDKLDEPSLGTHLTYKFITLSEAKKSKINSGDIYVDKSGSNSCLYLVTV